MDKTIHVLIERCSWMPKYWLRVGLKTYTRRLDDQAVLKAFGMPDTALASLRLGCAIKREISLELFEALIKEE